MRLVLLPGMDGTGELFEPLLKELEDIECQVVALPELGVQSYPELADYVSQQLPKEDFVLLAESFSGPLAAILALRKPTFLKGIILVATFLQSPRRFQWPLLSAIPYQALLSAPGANWGVRTFCLGQEVSDEQITWFRNVVRTVPGHLLKRRIEVAKSISVNVCDVDIPVTYLQAANDKLVPGSAWEGVKNCFQNAVLEVVNGPHFILQTRPKACADIIRKSLSL